MQVIAVDLLDLLLHVLNFAAPAAAVALLLTLAARLLWPRHSRARPWWATWGLLLGVGCAALAASLWGLGQDGRMAGYAALVGSTAGALWFWLGLWRH